MVGGGGVGREAGGFELDEGTTKPPLEAGSLLLGFSEFALQVAVLIEQILDSSHPTVEAVA